MARHTPGPTLTNIPLRRACSGMNAATEWQDVLKEALQGAVVLMILESLYLTRNNVWLEEVRACDGSASTARDVTLSPHLACSRAAR